MSIPKEPRQQMINIMYLVLTALLALNVSSEVLNAFKLINDGIAATNVTLTGKNTAVLNDLQDKYDNNPARTGPYLDEAKKVKELSSVFTAYVEELKHQMIRESGGMDNGELNNKKDTETPTRLMVEKGKGKELEQKITALKKQMIEVKLLDESDRAKLLKNLSLSVDYDVKQAAKLDKKEWTTYHFEKVPVVAAMALLTKIQGDAKNSEAMVLDALNQKLEGDIYKFDKLKPATFIPSSYVISGKQQYKADIFVAAISSTQEAEVFMGQFKDNKAVRDADGKLLPKLTQFPLQDGFKKVEMANGVASYEEMPSGTGDMTRQGVIKVKEPMGSDYGYYPFELKYQAAKPMAVVSPVKMNVLYIGLDNPLAISVPGVPADKLVLSVKGNGKISGRNGDYTINVTDVGDITVNVSAKLEEGTKEMGTSTFRVKRVPKPQIKLENYDAGKIKPEKIKACRNLKAVLEDFNYDVKFDIVSFSMTYAPKKDFLHAPISTTGSKLNDDMLKRTQLAKNGDVFYFDEIVVKGPSGTFKISNITYQII